MTLRHDGPLIGRRAVLDDILGEMGTRARVLVGEAGVGKSRLLHTVHSAAASAEITSLHLVATEAIAAVPLGVFVSMLPAEFPRTPSDPGAMLAFAASIIRAEILENNIRVLAVDDAHLLDAASAGLIHQLALADVAVYATVRTGEPVHDAIEALWKSGLSPLVHVEPFTQDETAELLEQALGGAVDRRVVSEVFDRTAGKVMYVLEVARAAARSGAIAERSGIWVPVKSLPFAQGVRNVNAARIRTMSAPVRSAAELVALGEPLDATVLAEIVPQEVVTEAEDAGIVDVDVEDGSVRLASPLDADALVDSFTDNRRRQRAQELVGALESHVGKDATATDADKVLLARLRIELGEKLDPGDLVDLAEHVYSTDPNLSDVFLHEAALPTSPVPTRIRIATLLAHQHRLDEAEEILDSLGGWALTKADRIRVYAARAAILAMPANRPERAIELLDEAIGLVGRAPLLLAARSTALFRLGRVSAALVAGSAVLDDTKAPADALLQAALTACTAMLLSADADGYQAARDELPTLIARTGRAIPEAAQQLALLDHYCALYVRDDLGQAQLLGQRGYADALARADDGVRAQHAFQLGLGAMLRGQVDIANSYITEALAARGIWCVTNLPWMRAVHTEALALAGEADAASAELERIESSPRAAIFDVEIGLASAAVHAVKGDLQTAARVACIAANRAHALGQYTAAGAAWYAATRYGDTDAASRLLALSPPRSPAHLARRAQATALIRGDAVAMETAASLLSAQRMAWFAQEAQAQAVTMHRSAGATYRATAAASRLARMVEQSPSLHSPVVAALPHAATLTPREYEIAQFASSGLSDRAISEAVGITLRTVQTHLARVYNKLGARSRGELRAWLPGPVPGATSRGRDEAHIPKRAEQVVDPTHTQRPLRQQRG